MRRALDGLYKASGLLAALFLILICAVVVGQVTLNIIDRLASLVTGSAIGLVIPGYSSYAGVFLAAASFFALAYTFRHGGHIRVSLVLQALPPGARRGCDIAGTAIAAVFAGYFTWYMGALAVESLSFGDVTPGIVPIPLWLPQAAMTAGLAVLTIALMDDLVRLLRGRTPAFDEGGQGLLEQADERAGESER